MEFKHGKPISAKLSEALKTHISSSDRADISRLCNVSPSTLREVMYRNQSITENNETGIRMMVERALNNCKSMGKKFIENEGFLEKFTPKETA